MSQIPFTKMHGLGNDFIVIDETHAQRLTPETARRLCDRRHGIGADQILWMKKPHDPSNAQARMEIFNADGSQAEMCGNGIRAAALYLAKQSHKTQYAIETLAGTKFVEIQGTEVIVNMGEPVLGAHARNPQGELLELKTRRLHFHEINMGNPHAVFFVNSHGAELARELGPEIERHARFPQRTNVEFVEIKSSDTIRVHVWERGAGVTLACGTGACASGVASLLIQKVSGMVNVELPGGRLRVRWEGAGQPTWMQGPATEVFRGEIEI